jgi:AP2 domain
LSVCYRKAVWFHRALTNRRTGTVLPHSAGMRSKRIRICSNAENQQNTDPRGGSSPYKGVSWSARKKKWLVQFRYHFVGYFADEEAAARAYDAAVAPPAGEFARLNFPKAA